VLGARAVPAETTLFEPAINTRAGVRYLAGLLDRFGGYLPAALAGYNAGPGRIAQRWIDLGRRRGDALFCELVVYAETEDYVKKILSARAAYRELDPRLAGGEEPAP
jgi:soluble lytic murein transglycosylase